MSSSVQAFLVVTNSFWVDTNAYKSIEGARNAEARLVAPVVSELPVESSSSSGPTHQASQTARAHLVGHHLSTWTVGSSPVEDKRTRLGELRAPVWGRHMEEEEALLDRRRRDLESAIDPTVPKTMKGPDAPTESERTAHEITHLPASTVVRDLHSGTWHRKHLPSDSLRWNDTRGPSIAIDFAVRKARN